MPTDWQAPQVPQIVNTYQARLPLPFSPPTCRSPRHREVLGYVPRRKSAARLTECHDLIMPPNGRRDATCRASHGVIGASSSTSHFARRPDGLDHDRDHDHALEWKLAMSAVRQATFRLVSCTSMEARDAKAETITQDRASFARQ